MKNISERRGLKYFILLLVLTCIQLISWAINSAPANDHAKMMLSENTDWYGEPLFLAVGVTVIALIILVLLKSNNGSNKYRDTNPDL